LPKLTEILQKKRVTAIDYATVELEDGSLPLLKPMSEIAGKHSVLIGAHYLEKKQGGKGILISESNVLILGGGTVGSNAAKIALGVGAKVIMVEQRADKCSSLTEGFKDLNNNFKCIPYEKDGLASLLKRIDLLIGAVLIPGAMAPKIITEEMIKLMQPGSVIIDVSIDQGGCIETSRPTSHKNPIFIRHGIIHYCVPNMPGIVPKTSTLALTRATLPYVIKLTDISLDKIIKESPDLRRGINIYNGRVTCQKLAEAFKKDYFEITNLLQINP